MNSNRDLHVNGVVFFHWIRWRSVSQMDLSFTYRGCHPNVIANYLVHLYVSQ